jgi:hypothetical protein
MSTPINRLNQTRSEYNSLVDTWQTIADLKAGASTLIKKAEKYLPRRPCEDDDLYQLRLQKFSYTPVYPNAVRELVAKLLTEDVEVTGDEGKWWDEFYEDMDGLGLTESRFTQYLYSTILHFGCIFIGVDRPSENKPVTVGQLATAPKPYIRPYEPLNVITWADDYRWFVTRQFNESVVPFSESELIATWTLWAPMANEVYSCPVKLGDDGSLREVKVDGVWMNPSDRRANLNPVIVDHGLPYAPMVYLSLDDDEWIGNSCYLKQLQHTRIESQWTEAGAVAGTIQRVFTPSPPPPDADERVTYRNDDYSDLRSSNNHILIGAGFQFVESSGTAISALTAQLNEIKKDIKELVSMGYKSAAGELGVVQQSGVSKEVDMMSLDDTVSSYTVKFAPFYEKLLNLISIMGGIGSVIKVTIIDPAKAKAQAEGTYEPTEEEVSNVARAYGVSEAEAKAILSGGVDSGS